MSQRFSTIARAPGSAVAIVLLSIAFLLMIPVAPLADPSDEVGGDPDAPERPGLDISTYGTELSLFAGYQILTEDDMSDTYGGLPRIGCEIGMLFDRRTRFVFGAAYARATGDPYHDSATFEDGEDLELTAVPVTVGFRIDASENPRFGLHIGMALEVARVEERIPAIYADGESLEMSGWLTGMRLSMSPEWRSADLRSALGLDFEWGGVSGEVGSNRYDHEVNLIGFGARLHYTRTL